MCGVAGLINVDGQSASPAIVGRMTDALAHRGPDADGVYTSGPFGVGHRRLAILDLSPAGRQPMATADGQLVISYNGEVYNFQELRTELQSRGARFRSRTDTEVVLEAWKAWGVGALERLNGMFAFAVWDEREKIVHVARDRFGIKPMYVARVGSSVLFASEIKALLQHPLLHAELDRMGLAEYLTFQNFLTDRTLFKGVATLPAGSYLRVEVGRDASAPIYFADLEFSEPEASQASAEEYEEELARLFEQAVSRQLVSDVPVSSYLSGGIDSGSISAVAARQLEHLRTFTVGFDMHSASGLELGFDERERSELMSYMFGTEHYEMVLKAGDMERAISRLVWHLEEPRVGQSYPNFYAAGLAAKFGKVVLSGTGGDELFGGYPWRYLRAAGRQPFDGYLDVQYSYWQRLISGAPARDIFRPIWSEVEHVQPRQIMRSVFGDRARDVETVEDSVNLSLYFEAKTFLHGLLVVEDKLSMAHGLETRVPFLDNDLAAFAQRLPVRQKLAHLDAAFAVDENEPGSKTQRFFDDNRDGKVLLRQIMSRYVPSEVSEARKQGFSAPDASWFRGESIEYVRRVLDRGTARIYEYVDADVTRALVAEHLDGRVNRRLLIWSLLNLEEWCRIFLDGGSVEG